MAETIFNLYSASIFGEHPSALWTLDDDFSFISLIGASPQWSMSNLVSSSAPFEPTISPIETVGVGDTNITLQTFQTSSSALLSSLTSQPFNPTFDCTEEQVSVCVSTFIYSYLSNIDKYRIGFYYYDDDLEENVYSYTDFENISQESWNKISHTFLIPLKNTNVYPYLEIYFSDNSETNEFSLYNFSVGQWSEQYNYETVGSVVTPLTGVSSSSIFVNSLSINIDDRSVIGLREIDPYGFSNSDNGYYCVYKNKMLAKNSKLPMVFGSGNITELKPSGKDNIPSVLIPGKGFLHESGKYKEVTAEFWIRINNSSEEEKKIFGPIASQDGLYINGNFLTIRVGHKRHSYYVGKWYRPILIDFRYNPFYVSLLINGDLVANVEISPIDTLLAENTISDNTDWLAFFCYETTQPFEIDAIAIYPYIVSEQAAKRKFIYGQGVGKSEEIVKRFGGISTSIDFPFADYTKNIVYPDMTKWDTGFYSNVDATSRYLSLPQYELPEITYVGDDLQPFTLPRVIRTWLGVAEESLWGDWRSGVWRAISATREANPLVDNYDLQSEFTENFYIKLTPNSVYEDLYGSISFKTMNPINDPVASVLAIFSINQTEPLDIQNDSNILTLLYFKNRATGEYLNISIILTEDENGIPIDYNIQYNFNGTILETQNLDVQFADTIFIAGLNIEKFSETYRTTIKNFFSTPQNISLNVGGQDKNEFPGKIYRVTFNNKFFTDKDLGNYFRSTGAAKCKCNVTPNYFDTFLNYVGNYTLLFKKSNSSMIMDIGSTGYWENSIPLSSLGSYIKDRSGKLSYYDLDAIQFNIDQPTTLYAEDTLYTENVENDLDIYATIQRFEDVGSLNYSEFTITKELGTRRYIDFDDPDDNIDITKYRLVDGVVAFPPKSKVDFKDAYITLHMEIKSQGVYSSPTKLQRMSLASLAFDQYDLYALNSPTGNKFYPFTRQASSYSNKIKNPFIIYKDSTPYLYLTGDSGIYSVPYPELVTASSNYTRGLSLSINPKRKEQYKIYGFHIWLNYNKSSTIENREKLFSIYSNDKQINFYIEPETGGEEYIFQKLRGKLVPYLYEISGEDIDTNTKMYQNGIQIDPYLYPMSWSLISVTFDEPMDFSNTIGQLEIYPGVIFNNVALFERNINGRVDDIFESHLGLSNVVAQDSSTLSVDSDGLDIFTNVTWSTFTGKPV